MALKENKRKFDLNMAAEDGEEGQMGSTSTKDYEGARPTKRRRNRQVEKSANTDDSFTLPFPRPESSSYLATPGKSILKPERSSHTTTPPSSAIKPVSVASKISTSQLDANPSSAPSSTLSNSIISPTSDDEDEITMQGVDRSIEHIEHTGRLAVISLKERGDRYKQRLHETKKQVSDLRFETAEGSRELKEARMMIGTLEHKNRKLEAEKGKILRDLQEATASTWMLKAEDKFDGLVKAKEKAEDRWSVYKAQFKKANQTSSVLRGDLEGAKNQIAYLEALLAFEERSGYSSMISGLQLE